MKPNHLVLFKQLINDENIYENVDVCDDFEQDKFGNSIITLSFQGGAPKGKKPCKGMIVLAFNAKGRIINMEVATKKRGSRTWQAATSRNFINLAFKGFVR